MSIQEKFKEIVTVLQVELEEYGGLLHLFDRQQKCIIHQDPTGFLDINVDVDEQIAKLSQCRQNREELVRRIATSLGKPGDITLSALSLCFMPEHQPLMKALIDEINELITRTQRRTRQNRMLLAQCVESARQLLSISNPGAIPGTYGAHGQIRSTYSPERITAAVA
ncbi:MAG: flagellar export chaperone FlgN [Verrucomicrobia bacterium]|jgi:flagellar biosynthesis/type III secretory pathway chaperone|nr:flagellar export chaperone FlgN [Verrucomicrobiota bacterium]